MSPTVRNILSNYTYDNDRLIWVVPGESHSFDYSDGDDVESRLLGIVSSASDLSTISLELRNKITDWPSLYHLSPKRSNLLRPLQEMLHGRILEIGAGCGAITRFLGETGSQICAVEGSSRRASIASARCRDLKNVTVIADVFHNVPVVPEFDVVTLIGVLEYARLYFPSLKGDPVDAMLMHARRFLRPDGILIVAIENQLGLKYFAGYAEDHVGMPMFGIEDCYSKNSTVTFGRKELHDRISSTGLRNQRFWFPFPDYKLPISVMSDLLLNLDVDIDVSPILSNSVPNDPQPPEVLMFSLEQAWQPVVRNRIFGDLANSFLVVASDNDLNVYGGNVIAHHYTIERRPEFAKEVRLEIIDELIMACPRLLFPDKKAFNDLPISIQLKSELFLTGEHWMNALIRIVNIPGWTVSDVEDWANVWYDALLEKAEITGSRHKLSAHHLLSGSLFDAVPRNLILRNNSIPEFFDQEWQFNQQIEIGYVLFRGVLQSLSSIHSVAAPAPDTPTRLVELFSVITNHLGINVTGDDLANYVSFDSKITSWVYNRSGSSLDSLNSLFLPVRHKIQSNVYWENQIDFLNQNIEALNQNIEAYKNQIADVEGTYSWRITAPLRQLGGWIQQLFSGSN